MIRAMNSGSMSRQEPIVTGFLRFWPRRGSRRQAGRVSWKGDLLAAHNGWLEETGVAELQTLYAVRDPPNRCAVRAPSCWAHLWQGRSNAMQFTQSMACADAGRSESDCLSPRHRNGSCEQPRIGMGMRHVISSMIATFLLPSKKLKRRAPSRAFAATRPRTKTASRRKKLLPIPESPSPPAAAARGRVWQLLRWLGPWLPYTKARTHAGALPSASAKASRILRGDSKKLGPQTLATSASLPCSAASPRVPQHCELSPENKVPLCSDLHEAVHRLYILGCRVVGRHVGLVASSKMPKSPRLRRLRLRAPNL